MDKETMLRACELRMQGKTWLEIEQELHYAQNYITRCISTALFGRRFSTVAELICYPLVREYAMCNCQGSMTKLSQQLGCTTNTVYAYLVYGKPDMPEKLQMRLEVLLDKKIDEILAQKEGDGDGRV